MTRTAVIAIGGNSLITDKEHQTVPDQYLAAAETCRHVAPLLAGRRPAPRHHARQRPAGRLHPAPLRARPEGAPHGAARLLRGGHAGGDRLPHPARPPQRVQAGSGIEKGAATVVTQCLVDREDPAFAKPNKPIGSFLPKEQADHHRAADGWDVVEDAGRGWRRVVASPVPKAILELDAVKSLLDAGFVVVAAGGGGIAVVEDAAGNLTGASAVIDKDHASSLLARQLGADLLVISTAVEKVCLNFGKPNQVDVDRMTVAEAKQYVAEGHFKPGSMLPKIQAVIAFLEGGGREAIITDPAHLSLAFAGKTGTHVVP